jgi:drug/metabolite transporter (DMT)-like permease
MKLAALTAVVLVAFAANSLLNRAALAGDLAGPAAFAALRLAAGAAVLVVLARTRGPVPFRAPRRLWQAAGLLAYMWGFSFAYVTLDAGIGALILFGGVQVLMFAAAVATGEPVPARRWVGTTVAFAGLVLLLWPAGAAAPGLAGATLMATAAAGWAAYTLLGRGGTDPLGSTAANFALAALPAVLLAGVAFDGLTPAGAILAVISGAVTSGLGYALWYTVLPRLPSTTAALAQLLVPVIAVAGGVFLLAEPLTLRIVLAGALVVAGVAAGVIPYRTTRSSGS